MSPRKYRPKTERGYKSAAFFDVDGTLVSGFLLIEFARYLNERNLFPVHMVRALEEEDESFRSPRLPLDLGQEILEFENFAGRLLRIYGEGIRNRSRYQISEEAGKFIGEKSEDRFIYTKPLIRLVREYGYVPVLVSGGPAEIVQQFARRLGIEKEWVFSTTYEVDSGTFTGRVHTTAAKAEEKIKIVDGFARKNRIDLATSAAFGDSILDVGFLGSVKYKFPINPSRKLAEIAEKEGEGKGWFICENPDTVMVVVSKNLPKLTK